MPGWLEKQRGPLCKANTEKEEGERIPEKGGHILPSRNLVQGLWWPQTFWKGEGWGLSEAAVELGWGSGWASVSFWLPTLEKQTPRSRITLQQSHTQMRSGEIATHGVENANLETRWTASDRCGAPCLRCHAPAPACVVFAWAFRRKQQQLASLDSLKAGPSPCYYNMCSCVSVCGS